MYPSRSKDPRTGEDFNFRHAFDSLLHRSLSIHGLKLLLVRRITGLNPNESLIFLPSGTHLITIDEFVRHIKTIITRIVPQRELYHEIIAECQHNAMEGEVYHRVIPYIFIPPLVQESTRSDVIAVVRLRPNNQDETSIYSSSSEYPTMEIPRSHF